MKFCSDDFSGVFGDESPVTISGRNVVFDTEDPFSYITDGMLIRGTIDNSSSSLNNGELLALILTLNSPSDRNISKNTDVTVGVVTLSGYECSSTVVGTDHYTLSYGGNKVWESYHTWYDETNLCYYIPIAYNDGGTLLNLLGCFTKSSFEEFLTETAYRNLIDISDDKYVYRSGGNNIGNIGLLNITQNSITRNDGLNNYINIDSPISINKTLRGQGVLDRLNLYKESTLDGEYVHHSMNGNPDRTRIGYLYINGNSILRHPNYANKTNLDSLKISSQYIYFDKLAERLLSDTSKFPTDHVVFPLYMNRSGSINALDKLGIPNGGTGAANWMDARSNFHIHVLRLDRNMDAAIVDMKERYYAEPAGTICFLVAHYNNKHDLAICLKRSAASSGSAWDIIKQ